MSDFSPPPPPDEPGPPVGPAARGGDEAALDELASALLDGELSAEDTARAEADPIVMARVAALQSARAQLRAVPAPPPGHADTAIAAALAAAAPQQQSGHLRAVPGLSPSPGGLPTAPRSPMPQPATARPGRSGQHRWLAAAAAIVVVALVAVGILATSSDDSDDLTAASPGDAESRAEEDPGVMEAEPDDAAEDSSADQSGGGDQETSADDGGSGGGSGGEAPTSAASDAGVVDLGDITSDDLISEVSSSMSAGDGDPYGTASPDDTERANPTCPGLSVFGDSDLGGALYVADATLDGTEVRIHVYDDVDTGTLRLVATDQDCIDVVDRPFGR